uniref:Uncharacterized protein n=1 Tax=Oryza rufipogon TaxID=4529 RepID=A0A0E0QZX5_ORYRU
MAELQRHGYWSIVPNLGTTPTWPSMPRSCPPRRSSRTAPPPLWMRSWRRSWRRMSKAAGSWRGRRTCTS